MELWTILNSSPPLFLLHKIPAAMDNTAYVAGLHPRV